MLRIRPGQVRTFWQQGTLAVAMSLVAGAVNASGLLAAGAMTSHMTGNITRLGEGLAGRGDWVQPAFYVLFFIAGAFCSALAVQLTRRLAEPVPTMVVVEAGILAVVGLGSWGPLTANLVTRLLCFAMGWQNALITRVSGATVRTTHMTGITTDLGIEMAHLLVAPPDLRRIFEAQGFRARLHAIDPTSDLARAALHLTGLVCFLVGATVGPLLFLQFGYHAMIGPALALLALVAVDALTRISPQTAALE